LFIKFLVLVNYFLLFVTKVNGGREGRPIGAYELAKAVEELGAGEILLNCIDCDGESNFCTFLENPLIHFDFVHQIIICYANSIRY